MAQPELKSEPAEMVMFNAPFNMPKNQTITLANTTNGLYMNAKSEVVPPSPANYKYFLVMAKLTGQNVRLQLIPAEPIYMAPGDFKVFSLSTLPFSPLAFPAEMAGGDRLTFEYAEISANAFAAKIPNPHGFMATANVNRKSIQIKYNL